ncbi:hypothetical protein TMatcc_002033 [Talaromyces marneffei ATCC 18224]|uniref:Translation initiation factor IF3, putative n=2 Tax=Talaromyces marneffei TaxID=37727 RepID=B6QIH8_TALMQ|nr:uncharacterized protein EYB26_006787 [Talaromyces marneffei]EEA23173.1 translation initiation factor IF3, putative [Talaromyces marneffei ATCC 18224]KAE8552027.1 hypothetical protein EYB25_005918 [Talaromyces marneffei]QGA19099.1 hypothetical protein EYB26_006787 [Talaromyces marneffei]
MSSLRSMSSTSLLLRQAFAASRYTATPSRLFQASLPIRPIARGQTRTILRPAGVILNPTQTTRTGRPQRYSRPINDEIEADTIQLVDQNGELDVPTRKSNIVLTMRRNEQVLVQLDPGDSSRVPVCKIMSLSEFREEERAKERAVRMAKHAAKTSTKQIELNWSIDPHDLSHRLKKLSGFIDKGRTVEIVLTRKRNKRIATADEIKQLMDRLRAAIEEANAHQSKSMEGEIGKTLTITVEKKN